MHAKMEEMQTVYCPDCGKTVEKLKQPWRCVNCSTDLKKRFYPNRNMELCTAIHAEERAIRSLGDRDARGATMFVTTFPCLQCSRYIIDAGISKVVYVEAYPVKEGGRSSWNATELPSSHLRALRPGRSTGFSNKGAERCPITFARYVEKAGLAGMLGRSCSFVYRPSVGRSLAYHLRGICRRQRPAS